MRRILSDAALAEQLSIHGCRLREDIAVDVIARKWLDYAMKMTG